MRPACGRDARVPRGAGYTPGVRTATSSIPAVATLLAVGYLLASLVWWWLLPTVAAAAAVAACALVLTRRPHPRLVRSLAVIGAWLAVGFAGAWWLRGVPVGGLGWVLAVLFVAPLPFIPWLYARSFADHHDGEPEGTS